MSSIFFQEDVKVWLIYPDGRRVQTVITKRHKKGPLYVAGYQWPFDVHSGKCRKKSEGTRVEMMREEELERLVEKIERNYDEPGLHAAAIEVEKYQKSRVARALRARQVASVILDVSDDELLVAILEAVKPFFYPEGE